MVRIKPEVILPMSMKVVKRNTILYPLKKVIQANARTINIGLSIGLRTISEEPLRNKSASSAIQMHKASRA